MQQSYYDFSSGNSIGKPTYSGKSLMDYYNQGGSSGSHGGNPYAGDGYYTLFKLKNGK